MLIDVLAPLLTLAVGVAYARRCAALARRERPVPAWRQACFAAGLILLIVADVPPLADTAEELVVAHMAQHLLIGDLAALLLTLGLTGPILQPILAVRGLGWLRRLGNPLVAFPLWMADLYLWHLATVYQGVLTSEPLHLLQHACFLSFGVVMWLPLIGPLPKPSWFGDGAKLGYIVAVRFAGAVLANVLIWSGSVLYPDYAPGERKWDISPLADQGSAGNLMMIETGVVTLILFAWLFFRAAGRSMEKQELLDLAAERGIELDPRRAARAVAAGQGPRLRQRLLSGHLAGDQ
jgi:cytochrome c oxidase assembly factor CtaG